ncbi:hypothetical protein RRG08_056801 [Elysia crispata]|uniref:Polypeptide N-acetylgalactosaminyltransferase n=1 Tax=Elysia crispata TaxID=231223 RepID=A0AAE1ADT7_9GAST|nr:hypothetical protein RRG08_056801 [Elysia crispata]
MLSGARWLESELTLLNVKRPTVVIQDQDNITLPMFVVSRNPNGPGEGGAAVVIDTQIMTQSEKAEEKGGRDLYHHNEFVSKKISIYRDLPYCWTNTCEQFVSKELERLKLPEVSVIIIFNNEAWTPLVRSVHSILDRTPSTVLREVILVDDKSTLEHLHAPLDKYFRDYEKVKIVRVPVRMGLINARLRGVEVSAAPVLVFLDSHIECFKGWAESMLIRIAQNPRAVVFPVIEGIDKETFKVDCTTSDSHYGDFDWKNLFFNWIKIPQRELKRRKSAADSYRSPTMPGGLFAISRQFFDHLGAYDPQMLFWGGENIELSFKTWMCNGSLELDPCSHVGHVFRKGVAAVGSINQSFRNSLRVAEIWMDDYKNYFYERSRYRIEKENIGSLSDRQGLRKNLGCQSFAWYLENIFPEKKVPMCIIYAGEIKNEGTTTCLDSAGIQSTKPILYACFLESDNQVWYIDIHGQLYQDNLFMCVLEQKIILRGHNCPNEWAFKEETNQIIHSQSGLCLDVIDGEVILSKCSDVLTQKWIVTRRRSEVNFPVPATVNSSLSCVS